MSRLNAFECVLFFFCSYFVLFCAIHKNKENCFIFNVSDVNVSVCALFVFSVSQSFLCLSLAYTRTYTYLAESTTINWLRIVQPENERCSYAVSLLLACPPVSHSVFRNPPKQISTKCCVWMWAHIVFCSASMSPTKHIHTQTCGRCFTIKRTQFNALVECNTRSRKKRNTHNYTFNAAK